MHANPLRLTAMVAIFAWACGAPQPVEPGIDDPVIETPVPSDLPGARPIDGCRAGDQVHAYGAKYRSTDGCNTCECTPNGPMCTKMRCPEAPPVVQFVPGSAVPGADAMMILGDAAARANQTTGLVVVVGRSTPAEHARDGELARRRAISIAARLRALGVDKGRLRITVDQANAAVAFIRFDQ